MRPVLTLLLLLFLASCAQVRSNVEVFHDLPPDYVGQQIAIGAADGRKANTIEFSTYGAKLAWKLTNAGFQVIGGDVRPKYVALFDYAVGPGQQIIFSIPQYGVTGFSSVLGTRVLSVWIIEVDWDDLQSSRQVYQLLVQSSGKCATLSAVIDEMLEAGFQRFPGESGKSRRVTIDAKYDC